MSSVIPDRRDSASKSSMQRTAIEIEQAHQDDALILQGAHLVEQDRHLTLLGACAQYWRVLVVCLSSFTAGMVFGYDTLVNGAAISMPAFLIYYGEMGPTGPFLPSLWTSLWTAMSSLAQVAGGVAVGTIVDRFGRRYPTVAAGAITMIGTTIQFATSSRSALLGGKILNGFGIGAALAVSTTYASEVTPLRLRGPVQSGLVLFTVIMQATALGVVRAFVPDVRESAFRLVFALQWAVGGILIVAFLIVPESPVWLLKKDKSVQARKTLSTLYGSQGNIDARLAFLRKTINDENVAKSVETGSWIECIQGTNLKRSLTVIFIFSVSGCCGSPFLAQSIYFLIIAGLPPIHSFDIAIGGFGLAVVFIIISWFVLDKVGRRPVFIGGIILNAIGMLVIGALAYAPGTGPLWAIAVLMNLLIAWQIVTVLATGWVVTAEISSYRLRAKTQSIGVISYAFFTWLFQFVYPYIYNIDAGNLVAKTGFVCAGSSAVVAVAAFFLVPDTAGMTTVEVDWMYTHKIPVVKFKEHVAEMRAEVGEVGEQKIVDA